MAISMLSKEVSDFKTNSSKLIVTVPIPTKAVFCVYYTTHKGQQNKIHSENEIFFLT